MGKAPGESGNEMTVPVAPEFFVRDLDASVSFYVEQLGFRQVRRDTNFAVVALGDAYVLLSAADEEGRDLRRWLDSGPRGVGVNVRIMVEDADDAYERATASGIAAVRELDDRPYGLRDFIVADPDGFLLRFASPIER